MRAKFFLFPLITLFTITAALAQEITVTDEELTKYATAMDSINEMSADVKIMITDMVKNGSAMTATRYNEISKITVTKPNSLKPKRHPRKSLL